MTQREQQAVTPLDVLNMLKIGNNTFVENNLIIRNHAKRMETTAHGQFPYGVVLSCIDSRVPVEDIFQTYLGDLFVTRIAGNIINEDILGSLEFSCKVSGAKLVLVLGHTHCGAIKSAIDNVELGNITHLIKKILPAVDKCSFSMGKRDSYDNDFVDAVSECNIYESIKNIRNQSGILKEMEEKGEILIVGAMYNIKTGAVRFFS